METFDVSKIPYEIWEKIAFCDSGTFNTLVRSIPEFGRKTLNPEYQKHIISKLGSTKISNDQIITTTLNGRFHSFYDRPAISRNNPHAMIKKEWCKNGKLHRENGPAIIGCSGSKSWCINGKLHRENGPAFIQVIHGNTFEEWWVNGIKIK